MSRHGYHHWSILQSKPSSKRRSAKRHSASSRARSRQLAVEQLEVRCLLSADPLSSAPAGVGGAAGPLLGDYNGNGVGDAADYVVWRKLYANAQQGYDDWTQNFGTPPDILELHSLPGSTKTIYLDFDGHVTRDSRWNTDYSNPNIITPAFSIDPDPTSFSLEEELFIQVVWERVSEDFRPFNVNVTTQDPGVDAFVNAGGDDNQWGIRVVVGGSTYDWYTPVSNNTKAGVAYARSFNNSEDEPVFVFTPALISAQPIADIVSHLVGTSLGLTPDGQTRDYIDESDKDNPEWVTLTDQFYSGHGTGSTGWAPIMGTPYMRDKPLTQWSQGEYWNPTNIQDDLALITEPQGDYDNGIDYRDDDHGNGIGSSSALELDKTGNLFSAEGIIERNTDTDVFSFDVFELGNIVRLDINPFETGPNLDVLARIRDSNGIEIYRSDTLGELRAGSQTFGSTDGGWAKVDASGNLVEDASGNVIYTRDVSLERGTYYVTVEGTGRPITFIDTTEYAGGTLHPGPYKIEDPETELPLPDDLSDWGYSKYGSLGYYSISGTRKANLVVGVDFDVTAGASPFNWTLFSGGAQTGTLTNLIAETGLTTVYDLTVTTSGTTITSIASASAIPSGDLPKHALPLENLNGYITAASGETLTFVWSDLTPGDVYRVYVFGHSSTAATNIVTVKGGPWNEEAVQTYNFTQTLPFDIDPEDPDNVPKVVAVNDEKLPGGLELSTLAYYVVADANGEITIEVTTAAGQTAAIAGLAIASTEVGSISGRKWHDLNGSGGGEPSPGEPGLEGWMIYIDENNNGELDFEGEPERLDRTQSATLVPQPLADYSTVKNDLTFTESGTITDLDVKIKIAHTYDGDLNIWLLGPGTAPNRPRIKLVADRGGNGDNFTNTIFDDSAAVSITHPSATPPFTGTFRPEEPLSEFIGMESAGIWTLEIQDDGPGDTGTLLEWSITMDLASSEIPAEPFQITDAAGNYTFTDLQPGLYYIREHITDEQEQDGWVQSWALDAAVTVNSRSTKEDIRADRTGINFGNWIPQFVPGSINGQVWHDLDGDGDPIEAGPGLPGWIVYIDTPEPGMPNGDGVRDVGATPTQHLADDLPKQIEDFGTVISKIQLPDLGSILDIDITLDITHSFMADLEAFLTSPTGRTIELFSAVGGQFNDFVNVTLDDSAGRSIETIGQQPGDLPYANSRWRPETPLSAFFGDVTVVRDSSGAIIADEWTLTLRDTTFADEGTFNSWSMSVRTGERFTTTDADGAYTFPGLPAGTYIVREEVQPGWAQTFPATNFHVVNVIAGGQVQVKFGNELVAGGGGSLAATASGPFSMSALASEKASEPVAANSAGAVAETANDAAILAMLDSHKSNSGGDAPDALSSSDDGESFTGSGEFEADCREDFDGVDALFELIGA